MDTSIEETNATPASTLHWFAAGVTSTEDPLVWPQRLSVTWGEKSLPTCSPGPIQLTVHPAQRHHTRDRWCFCISCMEHKLLCSTRPCRTPRPPPPCTEHRVWHPRSMEQPSVDLLPEPGFTHRTPMPCSSHHGTSPPSEEHSTHDRDDREEGIGGGRERPLGGWGPGFSLEEARRGMCLTPSPF